MKYALIPLLFFATLGVPNWGQAPAPATPELRSTVDQVLLNVVVRDKKGRAVKDVKPEEFEVLDNGTKVKLASAQPVDPATPRLVTLVFEALSPEGRRSAITAANDLLKADQAGNTYFSVLMINRQLLVLQPFTKDHDAIKKAAQKASSGQVGVYAEESNRIKADLKTVATQGNTQGEEAKLAQTMLQMVKFGEAISGNDSGLGQSDSTRLSIASLRSISDGLAQATGRKAVVYMSEGMYLPQSLDEPFRSMLGSASRGNVALYVMDARGFTGNSGGYAKSVQDQAAGANNSSDGPTTKEQITASDNSEFALRTNFQGPLRDMADATGGYLNASPTDFKKGAERLMDDLGSYYQLAYDAKIEKYDGSFRKVQVQVARNDLKAYSSNGYFALPYDPKAEALLPYEAQLINALAATPLPNEVEFRSAAVRFQPDDKETHAWFIVEVPMRNVTFKDLTEKKAYIARLSMVILVKDTNGQVVKKFTRDVPLTGALDKEPMVKAVNFVYKDKFSVPPGRYTIETAVVDREGNKIGAKRASFVAAPYRGGVAISSVTLMKNYEAAAKDLSPDDPFQFQNGRVYPTLSGTVYAVKGASLATFFVVYPDPKIAEKPTLTIEYLKDGVVVGSGQVALPPADAQGRIPYVMSSPAEGMPAGTYEIHAVVKQGTTASEDRALITVAAPGH